MAGDLRFDVTARDSASREFLAIAAQLKALSKQVSALDGQQARVKVALSGAAQAQAQLAAVGAQLRALSGTASTKVAVDLGRGIGERLAAVTSGLQRFGSVASTAASGALKLRSAAQMLMDPAQIPMIASISDAIAGRFRAATDLARGGVDRLSTGLTGLRLSLLGISAAGGAVQVVGALGTSLAQMSGAALLAPAALLGVGVAVGTLKIATAGFGDAVKAADPKAFAEATKNMAPAAAAAAGAVRVLKDELSGVGSVGKAVQTNFFAGIAQQVQTLGATYLPILRTGLGQTATQLNGMAKSALTAVMSLESIGNVRTIIGNTNTALGAMRMTVANAATGFLTLGAAGSAWLPRFASAIDAGAAKFDAWSKRITSDGTFDRWVGQSITAFKQLGTILGNSASIVGTVFSALNQNGAGLLATLAGLTTQMRSFLESAQGGAALQALGQTFTVVGQAVSGVLMAALRQLGPIMTALAPAAQALAVALGAQLVTVINLAGPALERFAAALSANPELLAALAKAATAVVIGFGPMVAIIGVAATVLKGMLLASLVGAALTQLGLAGGIAGRVLMALVSPMALLRELMPLIARGAGMLLAQLGIMAGPVGVLVVAFATLYATSSQFRDAANGVAAVVGGLFMRALQQAGEIINSTVILIRDIGSALDSATSGIQSFGSSLASAFGPIGAVVEGALGGLFDLLGKLPGAALAAFVAFQVFGRIAPLFAAASAAVAGFSARMLALQASTAAGAAAASAAGRAAAGLSTALSRAGAALPILGVALIAVGAIYDQIRSRADDFAQSVVQGSMSMASAFEQQSAIYGEGFSGFMNAVTGGAAGMARWSDANLNASLSMQEVRAKTEEYLGTLGPLEEAQARVQISEQNLQDLRLSGTATTQQLADAEAVLARDKSALAGMEKQLASATKDTTAAMQAQADQMAGQVNSALAYATAVRATADAQKAAAAALKENGANSDEYATATLNLAKAMQSQASAARQQAEALGGPKAGLEAYNTEILRTADLSTKAGRDSFALLASGLDSAGLAALSASAKMSGLRTEVLTLPDGRTVTVVVEADRAKLDSVKQAVMDISAKPFIGTVTVLATVDGARNSIIQTVQFADNTRGTIKIEGDGSPALLTVGNTKYTIDATTGTIQILGNPAPGEANLSGLKVKVDATTGVMTIDGNPGPANEKTALAKGQADSSIGTITLDGNPTLVNGKTVAAVTFANGSKGTITIDGNQTPANGKINATVTYADGRTGTIKVDANAAAANSAIDNAARDRTATIFVRQEMLASYAAAGSSRVGGAIGGIVTPMAQGGIVGYADGGVHRLTPMRGDIAQRVPANTWRVIGDRVQGDEFFLPDDNTPRSMQIGAEWARRRGLGLVPVGQAGQGSAPIAPGPRTGPAASVTDIRRGSGSAAAASSGALIAEVRALRGDNAQLRAEVRDLGGAIRSARPITVEDRSGNPVETARAAALALRIA